MANAGLTVTDEKTIRSELDLADPSGQSQLTTDPEIQAKAESAVSQILSIEPSNLDAVREARVSIDAMGASLQTEAAKASAMLDQPLREMMKHGDEGGEVAQSLIDLKMQVEELDPARFDFESGWLLRLLGHVPGVGTPIKRYFSRYQSAGAVIDNIVRSLEMGRDQLKRDNITLQDDQQHMRDLTLQLEQVIALGRSIDARLSDELSTNIPSDDPRAKFLNEEVLFPLRQRIQDLQQQLLVSQQAVLTIEMIVRNNRELIRGVGRALDVTVNALRVAATLAIALSNQKIVLDKIQAITDTTENILAQNAERLKTQGVEIQKQASETQLDMKILEQAFQDIRQALEEVSRFRSEALPGMANNINEMARMSEGQEEEIARIEKAAAVRKEVSGQFTIDITD